MRKRILSLVLLGSALAWVGAGCRNGGRPANAARHKPRESAERAMKELDKDGDGKISDAEMSASPGLKVATKRMDTNSDGAVDFEEMRTYFQGYRDVQLTLRSLACYVTLGKQPVPGATVTLIPEPFLGDEIKPATATTDPSGRGVLVAEGAKYPGVQIGIYRITVTRPDERTGKELIPAKYNTQTELGVEVSNATSDELEQGLILALKK